MLKYSMKIRLFLRSLAFVFLGFSMGLGFWVSTWVPDRWVEGILIKFALGYPVFALVLLCCITFTLWAIARRPERLTRWRQAFIARNVSSARVEEISVSSLQISLRTLFWFWSDGPRLLLGLAPNEADNAGLDQGPHSVKEALVLIGGYTLLPAIMLFAIGGICIVIFRI